MLATTSKGKKRGGSCEDMDKISQLPDGVLVKVLSFLPTKVAASTSILSKRWEHLWMWLPKLEYDYSRYSLAERDRLREFISLNLPLHKAPVIETFLIKSSLGPVETISHTDIKLWVQVAVSRCVRELSLKYLSFEKRLAELPSSMYISKYIVILKLKEKILVKVPRMVCLPSLKTLCLGRVTYSDETCFGKLVSNSPVLEDLVVERVHRDNVRKLSVTAKSLQRLTLKMDSPCHLDGIMLNTPCLKYLKVTDERQEFENESDSDSPCYAYEFKDMPKLEEADFVLTFQNIKKFFGAITSVKCLSLCLGVYVEMSQYCEGVVFKQLEHLKLCSCDSDWSIIVARLLKDSPNLRVLEVHPIDDHPDRRVNLPNHWDDQLNGVVPYCLLSSLETFKCTGMFGVQNEIGVAKYILRNASCLKTATFSFQSYYAPETTAMMIQELHFSVRASPTCQVIFE